MVFEQDSPTDLWPMDLVGPAQDGHEHVVALSVVDATAGEVLASAFRGIRRGANVNRLGTVSRLVVAASLLVAGCGRDDDAVIAASEAMMPVLAEHGVVDFIWTAECEFIAYERGAFSTEPAIEACELHVDIPGERRPIDAETRQVLDEIYGASEAVGPRVTSAAATFADGRVTSGTFDLDHDTYWFEPGYTLMEDHDWFCSTERLNADWYVWDC